MISNLHPFRYSWVLPMVVSWATAAIADTPYVRLEVSPPNVALTGSRAAAQILVTVKAKVGHSSAGNASYTLHHLWRNAHITRRLRLAGIYASPHVTKPTPPSTDFITLKHMR